MPTDPFVIPDRASEKELRVLIEHNREIIKHFKRWANATDYETACKEYKTLRRLVGADEPEEENADQSKTQGNPEQLPPDNGSAG